MTVDERLDHLSHDELGNEEEPAGQEHHGPARLGHRGQQHWRCGRDERADIGHEAHQHGEDAHTMGLGTPIAHEAMKVP
jgi:hypothetical protein